MGPNRASLCGAAFVAAASGLLHAGCNLIVDVNRRQCEVDADCLASFGDESLACRSGRCEETTQWECKGTSVAGERTVILRWVVQDALDRRPLAVTATQCRSGDDACLNPVAETDFGGDGLVTFGVDPIFMGFLEIQRAGMDRVPTIVIIDEPRERTAASQVLLFAQAELERRATNAGVTLDPTAGHLLIQTMPCPGHDPAGVEFRTEPAGGVGFYNQATWRRASGTTDRTDSSGVAGFLNQPPGPYSLIGAVAATDEPLGDISYIVRAGWLTLVYFDPSTAFRP